MRKLLIALMICVFNTAVHAQKESKQYTLPKKSTFELEKFGQKSTEWNVTFGKTYTCFRHAGNELMDGQFVNFCLSQQSECGLLHLHYAFEVEGENLVLRSFRVSNDHGRIIKRYKPRTLDSDSQKRLTELKNLLNLK